MKWTCLGTELNPSRDVANKWSKPFHLEYLVTISNCELGTKLQVTNPAASDSILRHQALLHNYIAAPASKVTITPLTGLKYKDKIQGGIEVTEERQEVDVLRATDSVYPSAPGTYNVRWPGGGLNIKTTGFPDIVIWNPNEEIGSGIGDLEEEGWYVLTITVLFIIRRSVPQGKNTYAWSRALFPPGTSCHLARNGKELNFLYPCELSASGEL